MDEVNGRTGALVDVEMVGNKNLELSSLFTTVSIMLLCVSLNKLKTKVQIGFILEAPYWIASIWLTEVTN